ncbi:hypothetical protein GCM10014715_04520 [Streptomyces spiralis]|uniref:Uncharacterized protein n=1 Tax=Streptomyces spiralis TaxID=66376 RepID=A0A918ZJC1_9ACTN|nr:hypothetical protein GCM10014715_04520 [Streptomyces spiralis]
MKKAERGESSNGTMASTAHYRDYGVKVSTEVPPGRRHGGLQGPDEVAGGRAGCLGHEFPTRPPGRARRARHGPYGPICSRPPRSRTLLAKPKTAGRCRVLARAAVAEGSAENAGDPRR